MEQKEMVSLIADIHNKLVEISVRGDDAIRMAEVLQKCRAAVYQMQNSPPAQKDGGEAGAV